MKKKESPMSIPLRVLVIDCKMTNGQLLDMIQNEDIMVPIHCIEYLQHRETKKRFNMEDYINKHRVQLCSCKETE